MIRDLIRHARWLTDVLITGTNTYQVQCLECRTELRAHSNQPDAVVRLLRIWRELHGDECRNTP